MTCKPLFSNFSCNFRQLAEHQRLQEGYDMLEDNPKNARPSAMKLLERVDS